MKKIFFGLSACVALILSAASCGNKSGSSATDYEEAPVDTIELFNQLTPEQGAERTKDLKRTATGIKYRIVKEGTGATPTASDKVQVNYEGRLLNGQIFDSSYQRGAPITFGLNQVIPGWTEALQLMKEGGVYEFYIPWGLAYGPQGNQGIPPYSSLLFKVELIKVNPDADGGKPAQDNGADAKPEKEEAQASQN